jgi:hypothetical protein
MAASSAVALGAAQSPAPPQDAAAARAAYARAIEKVEGLRHLLSLLASHEDAIGGTARAFDILKGELQESQRQITRATQSVASTSACLLALSQGMETSVATAERYRQSARESLKRTTEFSFASESDAPTRFTEAGPVFRQRFSEKQQLIDQVAAATRLKNDCALQIPGSHTEVDLTAWAFVRVANATRALVYAVDVLDRLTAQVADGASAARARGWLARDAGVVTFPKTPGLSLLRARVNPFDGLARLTLEDRHPGAAQDLSDYQDELLRAVVEEDAHRFLMLLAQNAAATCSAAECPRLISRAREQGIHASESIERAENTLQRVRQAIQESPGLGTFARDPAGWVDAQRSVEGAANLTAGDVTLVTGVARRLTALKAPVASAFEQALVERREAYRRVFGAAEPPEAAPPSPPPPPPPAPPPPVVKSAASLPPIARHAFEVLALRSKESPDYGAYTYVIFPLRERRMEYQALLTAIVRLTPPADPAAPIAVKRSTNLFEIPGLSAEPIPPEKSPAYASDIANYDWGRALSLVQTAVDGVLTSSRVLRQFQRSPGPFLLTVRAPLEQARGTTQLLLADLNGYPTAGYFDVVRSYQNDLVAAFPLTQKVWQPPWNQRLALGVLSIGVLVTGQNFIALRPPQG